MLKNQELGDIFTRKMRDKIKDDFVEETSQTNQDRVYKIILSLRKQFRELSI